MVSATVAAIAMATAVGSSLAPSTSSGDLVPILTIVGVGVSLGHDNINFELYWAMCYFVSILIMVIVTSYKS